MTSAAGMPAYEISNYARRRAARAGTTSPTGATAIMPGLDRARTAAGLACAPSATGSQRISSRRCAQRPRDRRGRVALAHRGGRRSAGHGPCGSREGIDADAIAAALRLGRSSTGARGPARPIGSPRRDGARIAFTAAGRLRARLYPGRNRRSNSRLWRLASRTEARRWAGVSGCRRNGLRRLRLGNELIIIDRARDVIVDGHLGVRRSSLAGHAVLHPKATSASLSEPIWAVQAFAEIGLDRRPPRPCRFWLWSSLREGTRGTRSLGPLIDALQGGQHNIAEATN